ncbi:maturation protein [ssRNA phage Esthiorhiza.3_11]|uniref:Maturation protein n=2 Tax=Leviviricetes TaxID=2842243 RepID=A0A8S5KXA1_9VIRU|nr:maturation protein [ssRNA phage Esthiorhiza.3_11]DAD50078.1 TPA_asm: maturation protein [ssRNA phage Esthiorhiza.3_11]
MSTKKRRDVAFAAPTKASGFLKVRRTADKSIVSGTPDPWRAWSDSLYWSNLQGTQETESENHDVHRGRKNFTFTGDQGGNFTMSKRWALAAKPRNVSFSLPWQDGDLWFGGSGRESQLSYRGPLFIPGSRSWSFPPYASSSDIELNYWGTKAIAQSAPTNSVAGIATALLEAYRDGLPHLVGHQLWKDRTIRAQTAGKEYLNSEFGWKPLANDIFSFAEGIVHFDTLVSQLIRDNGLGVRRRMSFSPVESRDFTTVATQQFVGGPSHVALQLLYNGGNPVVGHTGQVIRSRETIIRRWFSGMFTYHLPDNFLSDTYGSTLTKARSILGLDLTPETVWSIAPWSWAVDWFSSAGDIIHNAVAQSQYGLVLRYGYIMEHSTVRDVYTYVGDLGLASGVTIYDSPPSIVLTSERKLRRKATPFGFGYDLSTLNKAQTAIVAALALSKGKR